MTKEELEKLKELLLKEEGNVLTKQVIEEIIDKLKEDE